MLKIVGMSILIASALDLIVALVWVGLIGIAEIKDVIEKDYPELYRRICSDKQASSNKRDK